MINFKEFDIEEYKHQKWDIKHLAALSVIAKAPIFTTSQKYVIFNVYKNLSKLILDIALTMTKYNKKLTNEDIKWLNDIEKMLINYHKEHHHITNYFLPLENKYKPYITEYEFREIYKKLD